MKTIGITGGIGSGKSEILNYLKDSYCCIVLKADDIANELKEPDQECFSPVVELLGSTVLDNFGKINNQRMAEILFSDSKKRKQIEMIIHPAVKKQIQIQIKMEREKGGMDFLFVEAALLIEDHYDEILDELWYVYADETVRRNRLKKSRGYSDDKISTIFSEQLTENEFRKSCRVTIDNSNDIHNTFSQIDHILGEYLCQN